jgi:hypothetical protein
MKYIWLVLMLLIAVSCLSAYDITLNDYIDLSMMVGEFQQFDEGNFFVSKQVYLDELPTEEGAIDYIASTGLMFAKVQKDLEEYESTDDTDQMKTVEYIACPYITGTSEYFAFVKLTFILQEIDASVVAYNSEDEQFQICKKIVNDRISLRSLSNYYSKE